ncbi:MAG TPA: hypothetical protein VFZ32_21405 [Micromonosporaceae bacterium]
MIVSQTPLRVSLFGGGTDLADYYRLHGGAVLSIAINKYIHVMVRPRWDGDIVVNHWMQERVRRVEDIQHGIVRECLSTAGISGGFEVACTSDAPAGGSGLGTSSALTVGLLRALFTYQGRSCDRAELAELACHIEINLLGEPIGKQDQYAAAFGGCREYRFNPDGDVAVQDVAISPECERELYRHVAVFYTGRTRQASEILRDQKAKIPARMEQLHELKTNVVTGRKLLELGDLKQLGILLHESWQQKKKLSEKIHDRELDSVYDRARGAGAYGGKLLGAGGGGFFLFICPPERRPALRAALSGLRELPLRIDRLGSSILLRS